MINLLLIMNKQKLMIGCRDSISLLSHQTDNNKSGNKDINTYCITSLMNKSVKAAGGILHWLNFLFLLKQGKTERTSLGQIR